jgi:hypothetical protein
MRSLVIIVEASAMGRRFPGESINAELLAVIADSERHAPALLDY